MGPPSPKASRRYHRDLAEVGLEITPLRIELAGAEAHDGAWRPLGVERHAGVAAALGGRKGACRRPGRRDVCGMSIMPALISCRQTTSRLDPSEPAREAAEADERMPLTFRVTSARSGADARRLSKSREFTTALASGCPPGDGRSRARSPPSDGVSGQADTGDIRDQCLNRPMSARNSSPSHWHARCCGSVSL